MMNKCFKRITIVSLFVVSSCCLMGCNNNSDYDNKIQQLTEENEQLKQQVSELIANDKNTTNSDTTVETNQVPETEVVKEETPQITDEPEPTLQPTPLDKKKAKRQEYLEYADAIKVKVYNKKVLPKDYDVGRYKEFIELDYKVTNNSVKDIKGIKGTMDIYDQFDELIMTINWSMSTGKIKAGDSKKFTGEGIDYNQFLDNHVRLYNLSYKDLTFKFTKQQINFADGYKLKI